MIELVATASGAYAEEGMSSSPPAGSRSAGVRAVPLSAVDHAKQSRVCPARVHKAS